MTHRKSLVKRAHLSLLEKNEQEMFFTLIEVTNYEETFKNSFNELSQTLSHQRIKKDPALSLNWGLKRSGFIKMEE